MNLAGTAKAGLLVCLLALIGLLACLPAGAQKTSGLDSTKTVDKQQAAPFFSIKDGKTSARRIQQEPSVASNNFQATENNQTPDKQQRRTNSAAANSDNQDSNRPKLVSTANQDQQLLTASPASGTAGRQQQDDFISSTAKSISSPTQEKIELDTSSNGQSDPQQQELAGLTNQRQQQDELVMQPVDSRQPGQFTMATGVPLSTPSSLSMSLDGMILSSRPRASSSAQSTKSGKNKNRQQAAKFTQADSVLTRMGDFPTNMPLIEVSSNSIINLPKQQQQQAKASRRVPFSGNPFSSPAAKGQRSKPRASNQQQQFFADNNQEINPNQINQQEQQQQQQRFRQQKDNSNQLGQSPNLIQMLDDSAAFFDQQQQQQQQQQVESQSFGDQQQPQSTNDNLSRGTANELELMRNLLSNPSVMKEAQLESLPPQNVNPDDMIMSVINSPDGKERRLIMIARDTLDNLQKIANQQAARSSPAQMTTSGQSKGDTSSGTGSGNKQQLQQQRSSNSPTESNNWWPATTTPTSKHQRATTVTPPANDLVQQTITTTSSPGELSTTDGLPSSVAAATDGSDGGSEGGSRSSISSSGVATSPNESDLDGNTTEAANKQPASGAATSTNDDSFREIPVTTSSGGQSVNSQSSQQRVDQNQNQKQKHSVALKSKQTNSATAGKISGDGSDLSVGLINQADGGQVQRQRPAQKQSTKSKIGSSSNGGGNGKKKTTTRQQQQQQQQSPGQKSPPGGSKQKNGSANGGQGGSGGQSAKKQATSSPSPPSSLTTATKNANRTNGQQLAARVFDQQTASMDERQQLAVSVAAVKSSNTNVVANNDDGLASTTTKGTPITTTTQSPSSSSPQLLLQHTKEETRQPTSTSSPQSKRVGAASANSKINDSGRGFGSGDSSTGSRLIPSTRNDLINTNNQILLDDDERLQDISSGSDQTRQQQQEELVDGLGGLDALRASIPGEPLNDYPIYGAAPKTLFNCASQTCPAGYYADLDTQCQVFHICQSDGRFDTFLCPNGTIFSQQHFVCVWWWQVDCQQSASYYKLNDAIYCGNALTSAQNSQIGGSMRTPKEPENWFNSFDSTGGTISAGSNSTAIMDRIIDGQPVSSSISSPFQSGQSNKVDKQLAADRQTQSATGAVVSSQNLVSQHQLEVSSASS